MAPRGSPWTFHAHAVSFAVVIGLAVGYLWLVRRSGWQTTVRQRLSFSGGLILLFVAITWPVADVAAHWSLTVLVLQRLLLTLAIPPLLILGLPQAAVVSITRPAPVDTMLRRCCHPAVAVIVVTAVAVGTLTTGAVEFQSSSLVGRSAMDLLLLAAGFVLWIPVINRIPGTDRPSTLGRAGYLMVQSIVPSFLAVVWIFARHPLYQPFANSRFLGLSPLVDQQLAGFVAKMVTIAALWAVAFVLLSRAQRSASEGGDPDPLRWADVERDLERVERSERRGH